LSMKGVGGFRNQSQFHRLTGTEDTEEKGVRVPPKVRRRGSQEKKVDIPRVVQEPKETHVRSRLQEEPHWSRHPDPERGKVIWERGETRSPP